MNSPLKLNSADAIIGVPLAQFTCTVYSSHLRKGLINSQLYKRCPNPIIAPLSIGLLARLNDLLDSRLGIPLTCVMNINVAQCYGTFRRWSQAPRTCLGTGSDINENPLAVPKSRRRRVEFPMRRHQRVLLRTFKSPLRFQ